jgi:hypothetical protein
MVPDSRKPSDSRSARRLNAPRPVGVAALRARPTAVGGVSVETIREEWRVADQWWTSAPVRRQYFDLVLETGKHVVVFLDVERDAWFTQRA